MSKRSKNQLPVFPAGGGFTAIRHEKRDRAEHLVLREMLRPEFDQATGELKGYRVLGADMRKVDSDVKSIRTRVMLGPAEMQMNLARSATEGMSEERRRQREANGKPAEDAVERLHVKVTILPWVGPERGDILRVWPKR